MKIIVCFLNTMGSFKYVPQIPHFMNSYTGFGAQTYQPDYTLSILRLFSANEAIHMNATIYSAV